MVSDIDDSIRYQLIKLIEKNPNISQRELARELGVSLGKTNYCVKALASVGWIKINNFAKSKNKLGYAYTLTPKGIREKAVMTVRFLSAKQEQYSLLKEEIDKLKNEVAQFNFVKDCDK